jgi:hypothetical protein
MENKTSDRRYIMLLCLVWIAAIAAVNPLGEFPVTDDWAYADTVRRLLDTGQLRFSDWNATTLFSQVYWGALFGALFGPSNLVLRCSTLVAALLGAIAFYRLLRLAKATPEITLLATLALLFNPMSFLFSFSFMTDVPYTSLQIAAMWMLALGALSLSRAATIAGWALGVAALFIRQVGFALPVGTAGEALVRARPTVRRVAIAVLPFAAFVLAQELFQHWLRASGIAPAMYGRQIPGVGGILAHPMESARNVATVGFQSFLYLGFFALPLTIVAADRWRAMLPHRRYFWFVLGSATVLTIATLALRIRFPSWINSLRQTGFGQDLTGTMTPQWLAVILTVLAVFGGVLLVAAVIAAGISWYRRKRSERFDIDVFALVTGLCLLAPLPFIFLRLDRYMIPITPCALIVVGGLFRSEMPKRRAMIAGFGSVALMGLLSVAGLHDYMAAKRAQWAAYTDLARHVPAERIDAGWVLNGPTSYGKHGQLDGTLGWFKTDDFAIDSFARPGFRTIARYPVDNWLPWNWNGMAILVQQKDKGAVAR